VGPPLPLVLPPLLLVVLVPPLLDVLPLFVVPLLVEPGDVDDLLPLDELVDDVELVVPPPGPVPDEPKPGLDWSAPASSAACVCPPHAPHRAANKVSCNRTKRIGCQRTSPIPP
jgi:hypothetical protein